jgi:hypothetical protein
MIPLRANLDQLDKIGRRLRTQIIFADAAERFFEHDFRQGVQIGPAAPGDLNFRFEEQIQPAGKWTFRTARSSGDSLNAAEGFRAPRNDQTSVAELSFAQEDSGSAFHDWEFSTSASRFLRPRVDSRAKRLRYARRRSNRTGARR